MTPGNESIISLDKVDALFLDVGGTLIYPRHGIAESYVRYAKEMQIELPVAEIREAFLPTYIEAKRNALRGTGMTFGRSNQDGKAFWRSVFLPLIAPYKVEQERTDALFEAIYAGFATVHEWAVFGDAARLMDAAEEREIPMVIVSNWDSRLPALLEAMGLAQRMQGIICSAILGIEKPDARIFEAARECLPASKQNGVIMMVGDSPREDIEGARALGLETLLVYRQEGELPAPDAVRAVDVILP